MTFIMTFWGLIVFFPSLKTVGFRRAFKRLLLFSMFGLILDMTFVGLAFVVSTQ